MNAESEKLPASRLERVLNALEISVGQDPDGRYTASTLSEPLFCFVRDSEDEIHEVVTETIRSYIATFYEVGDVKIEVQHMALPVAPKTEIVIQKSRLVPNIHNGFNYRGREAAFAQEYMPWVSIPPNRLAHVGLFGIDFIKDDGEYAWYHGPKGRMRVEKSNPRVWLDDIEDAISLGATAVLVSQ